MESRSDITPQLGHPWPLRVNEGPILLRATAAYKRRAARSISPALGELSKCSADRASMPRSAGYFRSASCTFPGPRRHAARLVSCRRGTRIYRRQRRRRTARLEQLHPIVSPRLSLPDFQMIVGSHDRQFFSKVLTSPQRCLGNQDTSLGIPFCKARHAEPAMSKGNILIRWLQADRHLAHDFFVVLHRIQPRPLPYEHQIKCLPINFRIQLFPNRCRDWQAILFIQHQIKFTIKPMQMTLAP